MLGKIGGGLAKALVVVISKSGGTKETRNGMLEAAAAFEQAGMKFPEPAVAVTGVGSELDKVAEKAGWLTRFPMHDWVGGRTSVMSAVGLGPAALEAFDPDISAPAPPRWTRTRESLTKRKTLPWSWP